MIASPTSGQDVRKLWRKVAEVTGATNSLMNMTGLIEGKARGIGSLQMRGQNAEMKFFVQLAQGETGGGPGGGPPDSTTTSVVSSLNPSGIGVAIHFIAAVSPSAATGTIQFRIDGVNFGSPVTVVSGGAVSGNTSSLTGGDHQIDAIYSGDTDYLPSTGSVTQHIVDVATVVLTSSLNPSGIGASVRFTAVVSPNAATGRVQFKIDGANFGTSVLLVNHRAVSNSTTTLAVGDHTIEAFYLGDTNYGGADDSLTQTVTAVSVTSFYPYWGSSDSNATLVDVYGASFVSGATVKFAGVSSGAVTFVDSAHLRASIPNRTSVPINGHEDVTIQVTNPSGANDSLCCFRYENWNFNNLATQGPNAIYHGETNTYRVVGDNFFFANLDINILTVGAGFSQIFINPQTLFLNNGVSNNFNIQAFLQTGINSSNFSFEWVNHDSPSFSGGFIVITVGRH